MATLLNDRAFMAVFEKSKLEAKQRARQDSDLMVEGIYARMFVDLGGWFDANQQRQVQQQLEEEEEELQQESQTLPFIIETDGTTEVCAQIVTATSSKQNAESSPTLRNESSLNNQKQKNPPIPPEIVVKEEIADSVTVIEDLPSPAKKTLLQMPKPKENNATVLSNRTASLNFIDQNNVAALTRNVPPSNLFTTTTTTVCPIIKTSSGATFILLTPTSGQTQRIQQAPQTSSESIKVGGSKDSFEEGSKEGANNVEMVYVQDQQEVDARQFECSKCSLRFISETHLLIHSSIHNKQVPLKCNFCNKYFVDKSRLEKHIIIHYKQNPLIYTCTICSAQFNRSNKYRRHMATVHSNGEKNCDKSIQNHEKKSAEHQKIYWCTWKGCRFTGASREDVVAHVQDIHFAVQQNEKQLKMDNAEVDIEKYIRKVSPSVVARRRLVKTKK